MGNMNSAACELKTTSSQSKGAWLDGGVANTAGNGLELISAPPGL